MKIKIKKLIHIVTSRPKGLWRFFVNSAFMLSGSPIAPCMPIYISIEPTTFCNLRCSICETGAGILERRQGMMRFGDFKKIIDKVCSHTNTILLYFMGESFLNTSIYEMITYARKKNIYISVCTNGEFVDAKRLVESGVNEVSFQIGGITQEVHREYRYGGDLKKTMQNLKQLVKEKKLIQKSDMSIEVGLIVMKHNEHQVEEFKKIAESLGVDRVHIIKPRVRTFEQARKFLPVNEKYWLYDRNLFKKGILCPLQKEWQKHSCFLLWNSTLVTWDGDVVPCCSDPHGHFVMGNILDQDLKEIWNNSRYVALRKKVLISRLNSALCHICVE